MLRAATGESLVRGLSISGERTTVYNLTVDGVHTYLVGPDGVWVHNCEKIFVRSFNRGMGEALSWLDSKGASQLTDDVISRFPRQGPSRRIGRQTADGKSGWRLEYDGRHGAHINVWHGKSADTPHIVIEQFNSADVDAILRQLFP